MGITAVGDVVEVRMMGRDLESTQEIDNRVHLRATAIAGGGASLSDLIDRMQLKWRSYPLPNLNSRYRVVEYRAYKIASAVPLTPTPFTPHPFKVIYGEQYIRPGIIPDDVGGTSGDALPDYVAVSVKKVAANPSKFYRGGMRLGLISEADTVAAGQSLTLTSYAAWVAAMTGYFLNFTASTAPNSADMEYCVFSGTSLAWFEAPGAPPVNATSPMVNAVVHPLVGSQVSRKVPVGSA